MEGYYRRRGAERKKLKLDDNYLKKELEKKTGKGGGIESKKWKSWKALCANLPCIPIYFSKGAKGPDFIKKQRRNKRQRGGQFFKKRK